MILDVFLYSEIIQPFSESGDYRQTKIEALKIASYLTEPVCKVREYFYTFYILDQTCQSTAEKVQKCAFLVLGIVIFSLLTPFTTPLGMILRGGVALLSSEPYLYIERGEGKVFSKNREITLVSHNQCYMPAGYAITDGQVTPSSDRARMDANIERIRALNPDLICLYEVADICDASYISSRLPEYPFIIPVAGVRTVGPSSMMYVASKYEIAKDSIEFVPFIKGKELTGRAEHSEKGFLSFNLRSQGGDLATVVSTHLQHSEIPELPEEGERGARAAQMKKIVDYIKRIVARGVPVIFTGDLNQSEEELKEFLTHHQIDWLRRDPSVEGKITWGGDEWCAKLMGKPPSKPLVLDYAFVAGRGVSISTKIKGTGYSGSEFKREATSDHNLLYSRVLIGEELPDEFARQLPVD